MTIGKRIAVKRKSAHLTQGELADRIGVGQTAVSNWERDLRIPEDVHIKELAKLFGCTPNWLRYNGSEQGNKRLARLRGYVGAGDVIHMLAEDVIDWVDAPEDSESTFDAFEVRGTSQFPVYRNGDIVYFDPDERRELTSLIGLDCIIELADGKMLLKRLEYGSRASVFTLASYNSPDIRDQEVRHAAEVAWVKRARR